MAWAARRQKQPAWTASALDCLVSLKNSSTSSSRSSARSRPPGTGFAAFLSHFKVEAATEARWLQERLEREISQRVFLDSDDLTDLILSKLKDHVRESKCIALCCRHVRGSVLSDAAVVGP